MTLLNRLFLLHLVPPILLQQVENSVDSGRFMHALCVWRFETLLNDLQRVVVHLLTLIIAGNGSFRETTTCLAL